MNDYGYNKMVIKNPKIKYIFVKILVFSVMCRKCGNNNDKIFKEVESAKMSRILGSINDKSV